MLGSDSLPAAGGIASAKLMIIEDEPSLREVLAWRLQREGFETHVAHSAEEGLQIFALLCPHLIILDLMLPGMSGLDFCLQLRQTSTVPVVVTSALSDERTRVAALESGADDYLVKPFSVRELSARIKAILRRFSPSPGSMLVHGSLQIGHHRHEVRLNGRMLELSPKEFSLLRFLAASPGRVFGRGELLDQVWNKDEFVSERTVDVHVRWLREKIEASPSSPRWLLTVRGVGYKFVG